MTNTNIGYLLDTIIFYTKMKKIEKDTRED